MLQNAIPNFKRFVVLIIMASLTTGCSVYKAVQGTTGGSVETSFSDERISNRGRAIVSNIKKPAVWPGNEAEVHMAVKMQKSGEFYSVITPSQMSRTLRKLKLDTQTERMTHSEMLNTFKAVCEETGADAVVASKFLGAETNMNMWSFSRANTIYRAEMFIYDHKSNTVIYKSLLEVTKKHGGKMSGQQETLRKFGEAVAEKIIQLAK